MNEAEAHIRRRQPPRHTAEHHEGISQRLGLGITLIVGTMWCAALFGVISLISLPSALHTGDPIIIVGWVAQTFLQLVLLPVIIVGQNVQAKAADERGDKTYEDAEAILKTLARIERKIK